MFSHSGKIEIVILHMVYIPKEEKNPISIAVESTELCVNLT